MGAVWDKGAQRWYAPSGSDLTAFEPWLPNHLELRPVERDYGRDPRQEFAEALREAGLELGGLPEMDGRLYRVRAAGDGRGERSGWYVGHADGHPAGSFGDWRSGASRLKSRTPCWRSRATAPRLRAETASAAWSASGEVDMQHEAAVDTSPPIWAWRFPRPPTIRISPARAGAHGVLLDRTGTLVLPPDDPDGQNWSARGNLLVPVRDADGALIGRRASGGWLQPSPRRAPAAASI
jgi:hypothetical protein